MAVLHIVENNKRLDEIVFQHYGDLTMFDRVFAANPHLLSLFLNIGDQVFLPEKQKKKVEEKLW